MKTIAFIFVIFITLQVFSEDEPFWEYVKNPYGGSLKPACDNVGNYYAIGQNGMFITDLITPWEQLCRGELHDIVIGRNNMIFTTIAVDSYKPTRIIKSEDFGASWDTITSVYYWLEPEQNRKYFRFYDLQFDLNDRLYVSMIETRDYNVSVILYSDDYGETWNYEEIFEKPSAIEVRGVYKNGIISANITDNTNGYPSEYRYGLSYDNGKTWSYINIPNESNDVLRDVQFTNDSIVYFQISGFLYVTRDSGKTVQKLNISYSIRNFHCFSSERIIATTQLGIIESDDGGTVWNLKTQKETNIGYLSVNHDGVIASNYRWGFLYSTDEGETFTIHNEGYINNSLYNITFDKNGDLYLANHDIYKLSDNGRTLKLVFSADKKFRHFATLNDGTILASTDDLPNAVYHSTDNGESWELFPEYSTFRGQVQSSNGYIFQRHTGCSSVSRSKDYGYTWEHNLEGSEGGEAIAVNNEDHIFAACGWYTGGIRRSKDYGYTWEHVLEFDDFNYVSDFYNLLFIKDTTIGIGNSGNFRSIDNGETWYETDAFDYGLRFSNAIALDSSGNIWSSVWRSKDYGITWELERSGIPDELTRFHAMEVCPKGYLYIAAEGAGLFKSKQPILSVEKQYPQNNALSIIPNPLIENSKIYYTIVNDSFVSISIYDALGNEVIQLPDEYQTQGTYSQEIEVNDLPTGVYYCKMTTGDEILTRQFIVLK